MKNCACSHAWYGLEFMMINTGVGEEKASYDFKISIRGSKPIPDTACGLSSSSEEYSSGIPLGTTQQGHLLYFGW